MAGVAARVPASRLSRAAHRARQLPGSRVNCCVIRCSVSYGVSGLSFGRPLPRACAARSVHISAAQRAPQSAVAAGVGADGGDSGGLPVDAFVVADAGYLRQLGRRAVKLETNGDGKDAKQSSVAIRYNSLVERVLGSVAAGGAAPKPSRMLAFTTDSPFPNEFDKAIEAAGFVMPKFSSQLGYTSAHWLTTSLATELLHAATPDAPADAPAAAGEAQPRRVVLACLGAPVFVSALARAAVKPHATLVLACLNSSWKTISELLPEAAREAIVHVSVDDMTGELVGDRPSEREVEGEGQSRPPPDAGRSDGDSPDDIARLIHGALSQWVQQAGGDVSSIAQSDAAAVLDRLPQWKAYRAVRGSLSLKALIKASPELFATEVDDSMPPDGRHIRITPLSGGGEAAEGAASDSSAHAGASAESTGDALSAATSEDDVLRALVREAHARSVAGVHDEKVKVANLKALLSATPSLVKGRDWKAGDKRDALRAAVLEHAEVVIAAVTGQAAQAAAAGGE